jgi:hypothetical protein
MSSWLGDDRMERIGYPSAGPGRKTEKLDRLSYLEQSCHDTTRSLFPPLGFSLWRAPARVLVEIEQGQV